MEAISTGMSMSAAGSPVAATTTPDPMSHREHSSKIALMVLVPILLILVIVCVVLTVFVFLSIRKREKKHKKRRPYQPVSTKPPGDEEKKTNGLPYPPSIKITKSAFPHLEYTLATQLPQPIEISTERYPFVQHQMPKPHGSPQETRPPRLRTKRRGNHKHLRGKNIIIGKQETLDSDSPTPEPVGAKMLSVRHPQIDSSSEESPPRTTRPEITIVLRYSELENNLVVKIGQVVNLPLREDGTEVVAYVRLHFTPAILAEMATSRTYGRRKSSSPVFEEELTYNNLTWERLMELTMHIEVVDYKSFGKHPVLVQTEISLQKVKFFDGNCRLTLPLEAPKYVGECNGVVFLSLCYDQNVKKLSAIILRAKDLNDNNADETDAVAKISINIKDRLVAKLRTKKKTASSCPIFNEAVSCTVDKSNIHDVQIVVILYNEKKHGRNREIGRIVIGSMTTGNELRHWNDTISSPGKHIAEWHDLVTSKHSD